MSSTGSGQVVGIGAFRAARQAETEANEKAALDARAASMASAVVGDTRVQLRLPLIDLASAERDLTLLHAAVESSLRAVRSAMRRRDPAALSQVRAQLAACNRMLNARKHGP